MRVQSPQTTIYWVPGKEKIVHHPGRPIDGIPRSFFTDYAHTRRIIGKPYSMQRANETRIHS